MALSARALVTWDQARTALGLPTSAKPEDFEWAIEAASAIAVRRTRRELASFVQTEILDGTGSDFVLVSQYPVTGLISVRVDQARVWGEDCELVDACHFDSAGIVTLPRRTPEGRGIIRLQYPSGYDIANGELPFDLQEAVVEVTAWLKKRLSGGMSQVGIRSESGLNGLVTTFETQIPLHAGLTFESHARARS